jgi:Glycosyltransferase family 87
LLSHDVYSYWAYARVTARHDSNPYAVPPGRFRDDPATQAVAQGWRDTTSVYGPGFTATSIVVDRAAASKESVAFVFRALAAVAAIGATVLAAWIARRKSFAAAFVGWNPLLAISFAGGGHNDALMVALMLAAIALGLRRREVASGSMWILAGAVKAPAVFLLALQLVRSPRRLRLASGVAAVVASVVATFAFGTSWVVSLFHIGSNESRYALPVRLEQIGVPDGAAHLAAAAVLVAGSAWLVRQAARGRPRLALGACLLVLTSPWLLPWYATWPVALAAVEEDAAAQVLALVVVAYLLPSRIPF